MFQVLAQATSPDITAECKAFVFSGCRTLTGTLTAAINTINAVSVIIAILFLAVGGIKYITASGNKEKATEAKTLLTQVLIGLAIILGINIIISVFTNLIGSGAGIIIPSAPTAAAPSLT